MRVVLVDLVFSVPGLADALLVGSPGSGQSEHGQMITLRHVEILAINLLKRRSVLGIVNQRCVEKVGIEFDGRISSQSFVYGPLRKGKGTRLNKLFELHDVLSLLVT
jgi:hypothetical protein